MWRVAAYLERRIPGCGTFSNRVWAMTPAEHLRQLLTELGPALDLEGVSEFDSGTWVIVRDDETSVHAELNDAADVLVLTSELGTPDEEYRLATFEAALIANYAAASPFAPRLALTG